MRGGEGGWAPPPATGSRIKRGAVRLGWRAARSSVAAAAATAAAGTATAGRHGEDGREGGGRSGGGAGAGRSGEVHPPPRMVAPRLPYVALAAVTHRRGCRHVSRRGPRLQSPRQPWRGGSCLLCSGTVGGRGVGEDCWRWPSTGVTVASPLSMATAIAAVAAASRGALCGRGGGGANGAPAGAGVGAPAMRSLPPPTPHLHHPDDT